MKYLILMSTFFCVSTFSTELTTCYLQLSPADATPSVNTQFPLHSQLINNNSKLIYSTAMADDSLKLEREFTSLSRQNNAFKFLGCKLEVLQ